MLPPNTAELKDSLTIEQKFERAIHPIEQYSNSPTISFLLLRERKREGEKEKEKEREETREKRAHTRFLHLKIMLLLVLPKPKPNILLTIEQEFERAINPIKNKTHYSTCVQGTKNRPGLDQIEIPNMEVWLDLN